MTRRVAHRMIGLSVLALLGAGAAGAQTIDYGTLETLFGEPVTTSATGTPQRVTDAPVTLEIITAEQIRRSAASDLPELLRRVAGIGVWRWTRSAADVGVRGYNQPFSPRLLVLINGRQVYVDTYAYTVWSALPVQLEEIRQIEVVKGPNSALYGFNAVGGVINIVTYNPLYDEVNAVTVRGGTQRHRELSAVGTLKLGDFGGVRLSLGGFDADPFDTAADPAEAPFITAPRRRAANLDALFQLTDRIQAGVELTHSETRRTEYQPTYSILRADYRTWSIKGRLVAETERALLDATVYHNRLDHQATGLNLATPLDEGAADRPVTAENAVTVARLEASFKLGTQDIARLTGEYRHNGMNSIPVSGGDVTTDILSAGVMWDHKLSPEIELVNAVRLDHLTLGRDGAITPGLPFDNDDYDRSLTEISFNSGLVYRPTARDTVRLGIARGVQAPSLIELGFQELAPLPAAGPPAATGAPDAPTFGAGVGNPEIDPTRVTAVELGYDRRLPSIDGTARVSLFYQLTQNITIQPADPLIQGFFDYGTAFGLPVIRPGRVPTVVFRNIGDSRLLGAELGIAGRFGGHWDWDLNYTFLRVSDDLEVNQTAITHPAIFEDSTAQHRLNAHLGYTAGRFEADLYANLVSGHDTLHAVTGITEYERVRVPATLGVSARVGYRLFDWLDASVSATQLTQATTPETSGPDLERRVFATLTARF